MRLEERHYSPRRATRAIKEVIALSQRGGVCSLDDVAAWVAVFSAALRSGNLDTAFNNPEMVHAILWASRAGLTPSTPIPAAGIEAI